MRTKAKVSGIIMLLSLFFHSILVTSNIKAQCVADFADYTQCHTTAFFTDLSYTTTPGDFIVSWNWDFGDGGTSSLQNPTHTYAAGGDYPVTLIIESDLGCSDTLTNTVTLLSPMVADFSYSTYCLTASFTDASFVDPNDTIISWFWEFGDGYTSSLQHPVHTYAAGGNYTVTLYTTCNCGGIDIATQVVTVNNPVANFMTAPVCEGYSMCFTDLSIANAASIDSWAWDFGDGATSTLQNPCYTFASFGIYNVTLTVMNSMGCSDDTSMQVEVFQNPVANFTDSSFCDYAVYFTDLSIANASGIAAWQWDFGDGGSSTIQHPVHTYAGAGSYNVGLIVVNNNGCIDSLWRTVIVTSAPDADFDYSITPSSYSVNFVDQSTLETGFLTDWYWDFGDGSTASIQNPEHSYFDPGTYLVTLTIHASCGGIDTASKEIEIPESYAIGTNEVNDAEISIYPNPANNKITIRSTEEIDQLRIMDINGRIIDMITSLNVQNNISTTDLNNGVYILEITFGNDIIKKKFIINHK